MAENESRFTPGSEENLRASMRTENFVSPGMKAAFERQVKAESKRTTSKQFEAEFQQHLRYNDDGSYTARLPNKEAKKYYLEMEAEADAIEQGAADARDAEVEKVPIVAASGERMNAPAHLEPAFQRSGKIKPVIRWGRRRTLVAVIREGRYITA